MKVHFIHKRLLLPKEKQHGPHVVSNLGGETTAYTFTADNPDDKNSPGEICFAISRCHPSDNFDKKYARDKAKGRLHSSKWCDYFYGTHKGFFDYVMDSYTGDYGEE